MKEWANLTEEGKQILGHIFTDQDNLDNEYQECLDDADPRVYIPKYLKDFYLWHTERNKKITEAIEASKKIIPPKKPFYDSTKANTDFINDKFYYLYDEIFYCPHCNEEYYPDDYYYEDKLLPWYCISCEKRMNIQQIIRSYGDWLVTLYGIEHAIHLYDIYRTKIYDKKYFWIRHISEKPWSNLNDFAKALEFAKLFFSPLLSPEVIPVKEKKTIRKQKQVKKHIPYKEYLQADHWKEIRTKALKYYGNSCVLCSGSYSLNVHHRKYNNLWKEKIKTDLIVLCKSCHEKFHGIN